MAVTQNDLYDFQQFATGRLNDGQAESLVALAGEWEARKQRADQLEMDETLADIQASHADIDAGRVIPVADGFAAVRQQLGLG